MVNWFVQREYSKMEGSYACIPSIFEIDHSANSIKNINGWKSRLQSTKGSILERKAIDQIVRPLYHLVTLSELTTIGSNALSLYFAKLHLLWKCCTMRKISTKHRWESSGLSRYSILRSPRTPPIGHPRCSKNCVKHGCSMIDRTHMSLPEKCRSSSIIASAAMTAGATQIIECTSRTGKLAHCTGDSSTKVPPLKKLRTMLRRSS